MLKSSHIKFTNKDYSEFSGNLKRRINQYFKDNNISKYGNWKMKLKSIFMLCLYFIPFVLILTVADTTWEVMILWVIMGFGMSGIGLSIMHDANHNAYSKNKTINKTCGFLINFIGGFHKNWQLQHNVLHHSYTNVQGLDEDIDTPVLRLSPHQKMKNFHKYQPFYTPFLYAIMTIFWCTAKDFIQIIRYKNEKLLEKRGYSFVKLLSQIIFHKIWYILLTLILPILIIDIPWWQTLLGFLLMHGVCSIFISFIFQCAHVVEETEFPTLNEYNDLETHRVVHQLLTTVNFAKKSRFFSWFIGGLNYQIEHHLFPNICHIHYKKLSKIVKETALEYGLPYNEYKTFFGAIKSHYNLIIQFSKGKTALT